MSSCATRSTRIWNKKQKYNCTQLVRAENKSCYVFVQICKNNYKIITEISLKIEQNDEMDNFNFQTVWTLYKAH